MFRVRGIFYSSYFKSIVQLATGSFIAQIVTILVAPVSTRLYSAEELGIYTLLLTIITMFGPVVCGKYDMAIVSAKDDIEVMNLIAVSLMFTIFSTSLIGFGYTIYLNMMPRITNQLGLYAYIVIIMLLIKGLINVLISYNNRYKEYKIISSVYIIRSVVQNSGIVLFGFLKVGSIGLLLSHLIGSLFGLKKQSQHLRKRVRDIKKVSFEGIRKALKKNKNQAIFSMPAHFFSSTSYSILNLFISGLFGLSVFGYYSMSYRILGLPLSLISMNVSRVFFQKAFQEKKEKGHYNRSLIQITILLLSISFPMVILLLLFAPRLFEFFLGEGWYTSGLYVRILAPMYGIRLIVSALTPSLIVSGQQKIELIIQICFLSCSIITYAVCKIFSLDIIIFLLIISISYSFIYIAYFVIIYKLSKV